VLKPPNALCNLIASVHVGSNKGKTEIPKTKSNSGCIINFRLDIRCSFCELAKTIKRENIYPETLSVARLNRLTDWQTVQWQVFAGWFCDMKMYIKHSLTFHRRRVQQQMGSEHPYTSILDSGIHYNHVVEYFWEL